MSAREPLNEDVENPTKKPNVSLSSLVILMSVEMKSSKALCHSGFFSRLNITGRIYEDFKLQYCGGWNTEQEGLSTGNTQCQQHTSSAEKPLKVLKWDEIWD